MTFTYSFEAIGSQLFSFRVRQHIHILGRQLKASQSLSVQKQLKKMTHPQNATASTDECVRALSRRHVLVGRNGFKAVKRAKRLPGETLDRVLPASPAPASHLLSLPRNYLLLGKLDQISPVL